MTNEQKALAVSKNRAALRKRLMEARSLLVKPLRVEFSKYTFDFEHKRFISSSGEYILQWQLRCYPHMPESYENQQTNTGNVYVARVHNGQ